MYCQTCGVEIQESLAACASCGTEVARKPPSSRDVADKVKGASRDAVKAFTVFAINPVGGLPVAFENLGSGPVIAVGLVFAAVFELCLVLGVFLALPPWGRPGIAEILKLVFYGLLPFASILGTGALARKAFRGAGSFEGDVFIAGASLLPFGFLIFLGGLLGLENIEVIAVLGSFAVCYTILMIHTGCTRISKIPEIASAPVVSIILLVCGWVLKTALAWGR